MRGRWGDWARERRGEGEIERLGQEATEGIGHPFSFYIDNLAFRRDGIASLLLSFVFYLLSFMS